MVATKCLYLLTVKQREDKHPSSSFFYGDRKQEDMVHNVRRRLEKALMADMLAHLEDKTSDSKSLTGSTTMDVDD